MAGRIRTIKPELLNDEKTAGLSHEAWRLFVSLLIVADDYGRFRANVAQLHGSIFWAQPADAAGALAELTDKGLVRIYRVRGQTYGLVSGWSKHQKVDKPSKPHCPGPEEAECEREDTRESLAPDLRPRPVPTTSTSTGGDSPPDEATAAILSDPSLRVSVVNPAQLVVDLLIARPDVDAVAEVQAAGAWLRAHPDKPRPNGNAFLQGWFKRAKAVQSDDDDTDDHDTGPPPPIAPAGTRVSGAPKPRGDVDA